MPMTISPELEELVRREMAEGGFRDPEAVVSEALRLLRRKREFEALKAEIQVGLDQIAQGDVKPLDMDAVRAEVRRRMAARGQVS